MSDVGWIDFLLGTLFGFVLGVSALLGRIAYVTYRIEQHRKSQESPDA